MACSGYALQYEDGKETQGHHHRPFQREQAISFELRGTGGGVKGKRHQGPEQEQ